MFYKILILTPPLKAKGGVSIYQKSLKGKLNNSIYYFIIGSRSETASIFKTISRLILDYCSFIKNCWKSKYDLIHVNPSFGIKSLFRDGIFILIAKSFRFKVLVMWHGWDAVLANKIFKNPFKKFLFLKTFGRANAFTVLASEFKHQLLSIGIHNPVYLETTIFDDSLIKSFNIKKRNYKSNGKINILFLARIEKVKGIYETIATYSILKNLYPNITLTIAGDGSEYDNIVTHLDSVKLKDVKNLGFLTEDPKIEAFKSADIFLLPTYHGEGMPISILEAMAFGIPVITRPMGGLHDFFEHGKMGYLTESKDPNIFAQLIVKLIKDPNIRKKISEYNYKYAQRKFKASNVAKRLDVLYSKTIEGNKKKLVKN